MSRCIAIAMTLLACVLHSANIEDLVGQLDHPEFSVREEAMRQLMPLAEGHRQDLERLLRGPLTQEQRLRLETVLSSGTSFTKKDLDHLELALLRGDTIDIMACFDHFGAATSLHGGALLEGIPDIGRLQTSMTTRDHSTIVEFRAPNHVTSPYWFDASNLKVQYGAELWMPKVQWGGRPGFSHNGYQWALGNSWNPSNQQRQPMTAIGNYQIHSKVFRLRGDRPGGILSNASLNTWTIPGVYSMRATLKASSVPVPIKKGQETVATVRTAAAEGEAVVNLVKGPFELYALMQGAAKQGFRIKQIHGKEVPYGIDFSVTADRVNVQPGSNMSLKLKMLYQHSENTPFLSPEFGKGQFVSIFLKNIDTKEVINHIMDKRHDVVLNVYSHTDKFHRLLPGESISRDISFIAPQKPGSYHVLLTYGHFGANPYGHYSQPFEIAQIAGNQFNLPQGIFYSNMMKIIVENAPKND